MNTVIIGLGSNIQPHANIEKARTILAQNFKVLAESIFVKTKPLGPESQPDFINGAVLLATNLDYDALRAELKDIEKSLGRDLQVKRFGPRTIDLDILVWNNKVIDPDFYERDFLKQSVLELIPDLPH
ncbi:MAG: 2-amino-4-hydroxy-6-hydroxymethyldihydropteridine diphosphokinase [Omnitrophica WOR_2 bacterium RIFCSPHIGHO2_01_FULL_48_9]|nr:MAG: 2-amino-4-hydroxy-6-hydroxymethyldihydropteridine diphosphokinase [Omnitrophica WOR_2 bacterium RIFCSPHIGHO2_02_FULL_48_11]OGX33705.1 MAG: 2-amino-4-hydroxy-6-hydroxymethyldihydropteridine diphosphokinase [Omnitrophica WOR_2 bacterium RIFCSPHIGHO2_01_FULL_48_9]